MISRKIITIFCSSLLFFSCSNNSSTLPVKSDSIDSVTILKKQIAELQLKVDLLSFPADQRLIEIQKLVEEEKYDAAINKISELQKLFPKSNEAEKTLEITSFIEKKKTELLAEQERIKALGFKALEPTSTITIGYNKITFSKSTIGLKYIHDTYPTYSGSSWFEHTADRDNQFISFAMDVASTSKDPNIPVPAFYSISGDKLVFEKQFWINFARWDDYGSYLGNEPDLNNDFAKVGTVKFKIGAEISKELLSKPYIVLVKNSNCMTRQSDRFENPPIWYSGDAGYPLHLTIDDINSGKYFVIKISNL